MIGAAKVHNTRTLSGQTSAHHRPSPPVQTFQNCTRTGYFISGLDQLSPTFFFHSNLYHSYCSAWVLSLTLNSLLIQSHYPPILTITRAGQYGGGRGGGGKFPQSKNFIPPPPMGTFVPHLQIFFRMLAHKSPIMGHYKYRVFHRNCQKIFAYCFG